MLAAHCNSGLQVNGVFLLYVETPLTIDFLHPLVCLLAFHLYSLVVYLHSASAVDFDLALPDFGLAAKPACSC